MADKIGKLIKFDKISFSGEVPSNYTSGVPYEYEVAWNNTGKQIVSIYFENQNFGNWLLWSGLAWRESWNPQKITFQIRNYFNSALTATATIVVAYVEI